MTRLRRRARVVVEDALERDWRDWERECWERAAAAHTEVSGEQSSTRRHARPHLSTVGGVQEMADVNDTQKKVRVYTEEEINEMLQQALRIRLYKQPAGHPLIAHAYVHNADWSWNVGDMEAVIQAS